MNNDTRPIGVFDSGVGGISVLRELTALMPNENFIYFGDSANAPYGTRTYDEVYNLTKNIVHYLLNRNCKALVIACNTITAAVVTRLRSEYPDIPIIGIEPAIKPAIEHCPGGNVVVMATKVTLREEKFLHLLSEYSDKASIYTIPCPGLVEFVEKGILDGPELTAHLEFLLKDVSDINIDAVVLGCTHYPFVRKTIANVIGSDCFIIDGGNGTARETKRQLALHNISAGEDNIGEVILQNSNPSVIELMNVLRGSHIEMGCLKT